MNTKRTILALTIFAVLVFALTFAAPQLNAQSGEATAVLTLSSQTPAVGETVTVTLVITNIDSVAHIFGARASISATVTSFSCHPGQQFFNGMQLATYQPGESHTYQTTFIAATPSCVPGNDWTVFGSAQDNGLAGNPIVARDSKNVLVQ